MIARRMSEDRFSRNQVDAFIREYLETVPQLEALLLFWRHHPNTWSCLDLSQHLYVAPEICQRILDHLLHNKLICNPSPSENLYELQLDEPHRRDLLAALEDTYRHELIRVSKMIHENASPGLRDFARSFRIKKD
jgi:hypothetical protein